MKKINYILLILSLGGFFSCYNDETLEQDVKGVLTDKGFYANEMFCEQAVNAIYDPLQFENSFSVSYWVIGDVYSDDTEEGGKVCSDRAPMEVYDRFAVNSGDNYLNDFWKYLYQGVSRANALLENATEETVESDFSLEKLNQFRGEAYFLRAWYYFTLTKVWGPVPYWSEALPDFSDYKKLSNRTSNDDAEGNEQKKFVLKSVIDDLQNAIKLLPKKEEYSSVDAGRAHRQGAYALLCKAIVYYNGYFGENSDFTYKMALSYADSVISLSGGLESCLSERYYDIFQTRGENGSESLFEIQFVATNDYNGEGTIRNIYLAPRYVYHRQVNKNLDSLSVTGQKVQIPGEYYYGLNNPTQEMVSSFTDNSSSGGDFDPRLCMIARSGDTMYYNRDEGTRWYTIATQAAQTGYFLRKGEHRTEEIESSGNIQNTGLNYMVFRMADLVLLAAECAYNEGDIAKATLYVNAVRKRARESKIVSLDANRFPVYGESTVPADYATVTLDEIYLERRLELFGEGDRFFDLVRRGDADDVLSKVKFDACGVACNYKPTNKVLPIPLTQIQAHQGNIVQNPGY